MSGFTGWIRAAVVVGGALAVTACSTYPSEPRYSTRPTTPGAYPQQPGQQAGANPNNPYYQGQPAQPQPQQPVQPPVDQGPRAPAGSIEGGGLPPPGGPAYPSTGAPVTVTPPPVAGNPGMPGATYVIQQGDTISGVGRRFQTPVQILIDLNGLGPRGAISGGQRIILPDSAVDTGSDPYATGPSPVGVRTPNSGVVPPPPPPPSGNAALPPPTRTPAGATTPTPPARGGASAAPVGQPLALQWPVRGDILRRFGPVGMGERNNGINIGASAGTEVKASADGTVAYVGDDIVGQGLTVLVVHRDGWRTVYGHLGSATVRDGTQVRAGQAIGTVGLTAGDGRPSIHYEVRQMRGDDPVALDPLTVLPR